MSFNNDNAAPGAVLIDGKPIREFPLDALRGKIGFVAQRILLISLFSNCIWRRIWVMTTGRRGTQRSRKGIKIYGGD
jgi:ABC-type proline/glycine betaine transport system ATPase subunit